VLRLRPNDAGTRYNYAMMLGKLQRYDEAQRELEICVRGDPAFALRFIRRGLAAGACLLACVVVFDAVDAEVPARAGEARISSAWIEIARADRTGAALW